MPLGMPVRLRSGGTNLGVLVALRDVSDAGAYVDMNGHDVEVAPSIGARVALGFALPGGDVGLARGRVVRLARAGFAVVFESMNEPFESLVRGVCTQSAGVPHQR